MNPTPRRPMTADEWEARVCLCMVTFPMASWDKRFATSLNGKTDITEKQAPQLWRLFKRYRRQIQHPAKARLLALAETLSAPDLRKLAAIENDKAKLAAYNSANSK